jgi:hypothetical protein
MALADSEPKLIAEMLKMLASYGCARCGPIVMRKSDDARWVGIIEWFTHS